MSIYIYIIHIINTVAFPDVIASGFRGAQLTVLKLSKGKVIFTLLFSHLHYRSGLYGSITYLGYPLVTCVQTRNLISFISGITQKFIRVNTITFYVTFAWNSSLLIIIISYEIFLRDQLAELFKQYTFFNNSTVDNIYKW